MDIMKLSGVTPCRLVGGYQHVAPIQSLSYLGVADARPLVVIWC